MEGGARGTPRSGHLSFVGEGNDSIVLRLPSPLEGYVLRLRKRGREGKEEMLEQRSETDAKFVQEVALPLLGPLFVEPLQTVTIETEAVQKISSLIEGKREEHRRRKQLSPQDVALLCPDATTAFSPRGFKGGDSECLLKTEDPDSKNSRGSMNYEHVSEKTLNDILGELLSDGGPPPLRPVKCCTGSGDYMRGPLGGDEADTFCFEIKPKEGSLNVLPGETRLCRYCVKQHLKLKNGSVSAINSFCPQDFFSGDAGRMKDAFRALFQRPQNNMKVFKNGKRMRNVSDFEDFSDLMVKILMKDFSGQTQALVGGANILEIILNCQKLSETLDVRGAGDRFRSLSEVSGSQESVGAMLTNFSDWSRKWRHFIKRKESAGVDTPCAGAKSRRSRTDVEVSELRSSSNEPSDERVNRTIGDLSGPEEEHNHVSLDCGDSAAEKKRSSHDSFGVVLFDLQCYLISLTFKDCSLMLTCNGPHARAGPSSGSSPFWVQHKGAWFQSQITVVDLTSKTPSRIFKHEKVLNQLTELLLSLDASGKCPSCCYVQK